jgi:prepilin-type N-terminal cleavage/methylation domain-containing protein
MIYRRKNKLREEGFTIVELMIATAILSVILLIVTALLIGIGNLYYKGVSQAAVQDNVRTITDVISQDLQLNGDSLLTDPHTNPTDPRSYCIGTTRYTYVVGEEITSANPVPTYQSNHVLWRDTVPAGTCPEMPESTFDSLSLTNTNPDGSGGTNGTELIGSSSMLTNFTIANTTSPFTITIGEAYGSADLLCDTGTTNDCITNGNSNHIWNPNVPVGNVLCKDYAAHQLCATDKLTTTVSERL